MITIEPTRAINDCDKLQIKQGLYVELTYDPEEAHDDIFTEAVRLLCKIKNASVKVQEITETSDLEIVKLNNYVNICLTYHS